MQAAIAIPVRLGAGGAFRCRANLLGVNSGGGKPATELPERGGGRPAAGLREASADGTGGRRGIGSGSTGPT
eukprot:12902390-Prorocentrum_lima.AAC.1